MATDLAHSLNLMVAILEEKNEAALDVCLALAEAKSENIRLKQEQKRLRCRIAEENERLLNG